jgi:arylsulfatase A-like enzyme
MRRAIQILAAVLLGLILATRLVIAGQAEHVVVVVWDGMRPDFVSAEDTPTLHALARRGTFFSNHHSTYVTSTEVNGTAIATGMYPEHSGILGNLQYRPELSWLSSYATESLDAVRRGDLVLEGGYLPVPTLAEILQSAGIRTVTAGAKPVVLLHDRGIEKTGPAQKGSITLFRGKTLPRAALAELEANPAIGAFPKEPKTDTRAQRALASFRKGRDKALTWLNGKPLVTPLARQIDAWTTRAVIHGLWRDAVPKYTLLWLSEPDAAQHQTSPGSPNAKEALKSSDRNLGLILDALKQKGVLDRSDIFVVSDHGFSTVDRGPDVIKALKKANFIAGKEFDNPAAGDVMVTSLGGTTFFYVFEHHEPTIRRVVDFLQESSFAGVIFARVSVEGTFPLSRIRLDAGTNAPDVVVSMRWNTKHNDWGAPGLVLAHGGKRGAGTHASLSRFDCHNTLIAVGPDFKTNFVSDVPSGNVDIAPTVLDLLGVPPGKTMDGRVLREAMIGGESPKLEQTTYNASRDLGVRHWEQYLKVSEVGPVVYFDEGNGESK